MAAMNFSRRYAPWSEYAPEEQESIVTLLGPHYLAMAYGMGADFARAIGVEPDSPEHHARWAALLEECQAALAGAYDPGDQIFTLFAHDPAGRRIAVATMATAFGSRQTPIAEAPGDPQSTIPTLRILLFSFGEEVPLAVRQLPEARVAEFMRLCVMQTPELAALQEQGAITPAMARYIRQYGFDVALSGGYLSGQQAATPPALYLFNVKPRLARALVKKGLEVPPLFLGGAEPTERVLAGGAFSRRYFDWGDELRRVLPPEYAATTTGAAISHLARLRPDLLGKLAVSLPYYFANDARTAAVMAALDAAARRD